MDENNQKKTSLGMNENVEGLLCYALGWVTGLIFLLLEKESKFVKFHAIQSIIVFLALQIIAFVIGRIPFLGWMVSWLIGILELVLWIVLMVKAYKGEMYKLPFAGDLAEQQANNSASM